MSYSMDDIIEGELLHCKYISEVWDNKKEIQLAIIKSRIFGDAIYKSLSHLDKKSNKIIPSYLIEEMNELLVSKNNYSKEKIENKLNYIFEKDKDNYFNPIKTKHLVDLIKKYNDLRQDCYEKLGFNTELFKLAKEESREETIICNNLDLFYDTMTFLIEAETDLNLLCDNYEMSKDNIKSYISNLNIFSKESIYVLNKSFN